MRHPRQGVGAAAAAGLVPGRLGQRPGREPARPRPLHLRGQTRSSAGSGCCPTARRSGAAASSARSRRERHALREPAQRPRVQAGATRSPLVLTAEGYAPTRCRLAGWRIASATPAEFVRVYASRSPASPALAGSGGASSASLGRGCLDGWPSRSALGRRARVSVAGGARDESRAGRARGGRAAGGRAARRCRAGDAARDRARSARAAAGRPVRGRGDGERAGGGVRRAARASSRRGCAFAGKRS